MINLNTSIEKISLYRNGAEILRKGSAELAEGTQTLIVQGLTGTARNDTARLFANGGLSCSNMRIYVPEQDDSEDSEYSRLQDEMSMITKKIEAKQFQLKLWKDNGDFSTRTEQSMSEMQDYIEKLGERIIALEQEIKALEKEYQKLNKKANELQGQERRPVMSVDVTAPKAGTYSFELRYYENSAYWNPVYEIHSDAENPVEIKFRANIYQYTPEDWKDVSMSLFTGNPAVGGSLPRLDPVYLDIREVIVERKASRNTMAFGAGMAAPMMSMAKMNMAVADEAVEEDEAMMAPMARMTMQQAQVNKDETMTEYVLPGTRNIPKNAAGIMADLQNFEVPAEYRISAVPRLDLRAYLTARIKSADIPFTDRVTAGIYLKGMYTENVTIDPDLTEEYVDISLGREERVKLTHKELARKTSTTLLKGQKVVEYSYETKAANLSEAPLTLHIEDRIPVSQNKDITVEPVALSEGKLTEETGMVKWELPLAPAESKTIRLGYKVSRPKDKEITERGGGGVKYCPHCGAVVTGRFCPECGSVV